MIPSLSGGLYKFNGERLEAVPITVEHLLQASFKYSDDLVISGGKESQTFGVSLQSGKILYECSMKGCENSSRANDVGDILVIQRLGQTVRAIEPRTGSERWNFSVAQHDLKLLSECHDQESNELNFDLKVIVPDGLICATDVKDKNKILWQHRFNSPIVNAWQIRKGKLFLIDLFGGFQPEKLDMVISPSLYIGMHEKQLYIQESVLMQKKREEITMKMGQNLISNENYDISIPWKPVSASKNIAGLIAGDVHENLDELSQRQTTALSVLYASPYVDGSGFYLYSEDSAGIQNSLTVKDTHLREEDFEEDTPVQIVIVSLWYWWKEVFVISLTTAILFNVMFTRRFLLRRSGRLDSPVVEIIEGPVRGNDSGIDVTGEKSETELRSSPDFNSRYLTDFEPVACLGRGGFGVVFEAKNKIDDCHYAIKRIVLPISQESKDRVMREVKALAKLDHHHIVRYFHAWTECPPPGWQETHDRLLIDRLDMSSGLEPTSTRRKHIPLSTTSAMNSSRIEFKDGFIPPARSEISDSYIVFDEAYQKDSESKFSETKYKAESIVNVASESEESDRFTKSRVNRPKTLTFSERTCDLNCKPKDYLYIQMQLCQRESLRDWLTSHVDRDYNHVLRIFDQILQAVEHIHLHELIHRDLKPSNIFFSLDNEIKVGDFGLVTAMTEGDKQMSPCECSKVNMDKERHTAQVGTQLYMSPEQLSGKNYNYKVDIYSLGLILFELLVPFDSQMERSLVLADIKKDKYPEDFKKKYKTEYDLLRLMLSHSPDERPTTYGVRARLLKQDFHEQWHFDLPKRRRVSSKTSSTSRSSSEGSAD
ncbi:UNVERIFIED_CONTAM: hypothetical protein PYX00_007511 [Menopon gallinae]